MKPIQEYLKDIAQKLAKGNATEHTYRSALSNLSAALLSSNYALTNEPKRQACGAPDYILDADGIPIGYIEAKDIGTDLDKVENSDQMRRYLASLDNLILTDYLEFRFYRSGAKIRTIRIASAAKSRVTPDSTEFSAFNAHYTSFAESRTQTIKSPKALADMMAKRAVLVKDVLNNILQSDDESGLHDQFEAFKKVLIHDVTAEEFADIYAETIAYGLFTARLHDKTPDTFTREEAYRLIPRSNPFLRELFTYVGTRLDERAEWIVDELCDVFRATDIQQMLAGFNRGTGRDDPFLHFYETFLSAYNPEKKDARGVWYTPQPVVEFIVRAVDDVLTSSFGLSQGLADTSTTTIRVETQRGDRRGKKNTVMVDREVHRVQILDVATGTGTFLAEAIAHIYRKFKGQQGKWSSYVEQHLIPRLYGFELLMASYAMCHMKLELLLEETGYKPKATVAPRLNVYLTNSLQKPDAELDKLPLIEWFSRESNEASYIKKYSPIMVAIGNPPYSGVSSNKGDAIVDVEPYKYVNKVHFNEKKHWLNDDYVKFMRLGEYFIDRNGHGVLAYITNNGYIDNPTFRGMRWHLLQTFDELFVLDLHGNSNKQERNPAGGSDQNVFDIQQGVSIIVAVKITSGKKGGAPATVWHADLWGSREQKYKFLRSNVLKSIKWQRLEPCAPFYYFVPRETSGRDTYDKGFCISKLFTLSGAGIVTARDEFSIDLDAGNLLKRLTQASKMKVEEARSEFDLRKDVESWHVEWALADLKETGPSKRYIRPVLYRPYDTRWIYYTERSGGVLARPNARVMKHMLQPDNIALIAPKQSHGSYGAFVTNGLAAHKAFDGYNINTIFPLYTVDNDDLLSEKRPNLDPAIWKRLQKEGGGGAKNPEMVFDYVYGMLHAPQYHAAFSHFHKDAFPKVPYPEDAATFRKVAALGHRLRNAHLLRNVPTVDGVAAFPVDGDDVIRRVIYKDGHVWINDEQYFDDVPSDVWANKVGGYFPAKKWLGDRLGRQLTFDDVSHYQTLISAQTEALSVIAALGELDLPMES